MGATQALPEFDPSKPFEAVAHAGTPEFDPSKPFTSLDHVEPAQPSAGSPNQRQGVISYLGDAASNVGHMLKSGAVGAFDAAIHPIDTGKNIANSIEHFDGSDLYRMARNTQGLGAALDDAVKSGVALKGLVQGGSPEAGEQAKQAFSDAQNNADAQHAQEHPLTDMIQRTLPMLFLGGGTEGVVGKVGTLAVDAFKRSLDKGNDTLTAANDAKNVMALSGIMLGLSKAHSMASEPLGVTESEGVGATIPEAQAPQAQPVRPFNNFPTKDELIYDNQRMAGVNPQAPRPEAINPSDVPSQVLPTPENSPIPKPSPTPIPSDMPVAPEQAGSSFFKKALGAAGTYFGAHTGPLGALVGKGIGEAGGGAIDNLVSSYGREAVDSAQGAGINLQALVNTPFLIPIMRSAQNSPKDLAVTHYTLSQTNPEYQKIVNSH